LERKRKREEGSTVKQILEGYKKRTRGGVLVLVYRKYRDMYVHIEKDAKKPKA